MKKLLLGVAFFAATMSVKAQGLYLSAKAGYAMGIGSELGTNRTYDSNGDLTSGKNINGSYGSGIPLTIEAGYMFNEYFGAQLDLTYKIGTAVTSNELTYGDGSMDKFTGNNSHFRLAPQLIVKAPFGVYSRFGTLLPLAGSTIRINEDNTSDLNLDGTNDLIMTEGKATGFFTAGFIGAIGYEIPMGENGAFLVEMEYVGLNINIKKYEITKYEVGGEDMMSSIPDDQKITEFEKEITESSENPLTSKTPYSSIGINIGYRIKL